MPQTVLVRTSDGFIHGVSRTGIDYADVLSARPGVFTVLTEPTWTDGQDLQTAEGDRRALGTAKFAVVGTNTIRLATQPEIDQWAVTDTAEKQARKTAQLKALMSRDTGMRKLILGGVRQMINEAIKQYVDVSARTGTKLTRAEAKVIIDALGDSD